MSDSTMSTGSEKLSCEIGSRGWYLHGAGYGSAKFPRGFADKVSMAFCAAYSSIFSTRERKSHWSE